MNYATTRWLVGVALALLAYILFYEMNADRSRLAASQPSAVFPDLNLGGVDSLEIHRTNGVIRVERVDSSWRLVSPAYSAQSTGIESFLQAVGQLRRLAYIQSHEVASQSNVWAAFGLDPPQLSVRITEGTNRLGFHVGARTPLRDQLYLQREGDVGVFVTEAALLDFVPSHADQWRNPMLIHLQRPVVDRISMASAAGTRVVVERDPTNQIWRLTYPYAARADFRIVEFLLQQLYNTRITRFVTDDPRANLETYGLSTPEVELTLGQGTETLFQAQFGRPTTNDPSQVFARRLSHTNIVLVPAEVLELLRRPHTDFRDRKLLRFNAASVQRIEVKALDDFALQRQPNGPGWVVEPLNFPADNELVQNFLENLGSLEIVRFVNDVVTDFSEFRLATPARHYALKTSVSNGSGQTNQLLAQVEFSSVDNSRPDIVYARRADEISVYAVSYGDTLRLPQQAFELRERSIWRFSQTNVTALAISQGERAIRLERDARRLWSPDVIMHAALEDITSQLGELRVVEWVAHGDNMWKALAPENPFRLEIELSSAGQRQTLQLSFGKISRTGHYYAAVPQPDGQPLVFKFPIPLWAKIADYLLKLLSAPVVTPAP